MAKHETAAAAVRIALQRLPLVMLIGIGVFITLCGVTLLARHVQKQRGVGAVVSPVLPTVAYGDEPVPAGRRAVDIAYTSIDAPGNGEVSSQVVWDDAWFERDPAAYNHELATASSVLAALAYSESGYYQAGNEQPAYMENALAELGFQDVSTDSYRYRSEVVDEVLNLFTDESDTVAYTIARKHLASDSGAAADGRGGEGAPVSDGTKRDLILVSIRGSYGSEWLSNLNLIPAGNPDAQVTATASDRSSEETSPLADALLSWMSFAATLAGQPSQSSSAPDGTETKAASPSHLNGADDHSGYFPAAAEICAELDRWIEASRDDGRDVVVLLTGHSRGGAIANLVASELDDALAVKAAKADIQSHAKAADSPSNLSQVSAVYAYTFASPATTMSEQAHAERYDNIFNIVNPSDIMPYLPLRAWGYERYGVNLYLPAIDDEGFDAGYADMRRAYEQTVDVESGYDPEDKYVVDRVVNDVSRQVTAVQDLMTPAGVAAAVASCATHIDPMRILRGHYPSTYIAWMGVLNAENLAHD